MKDHPDTAQLDGHENGEVKRRHFESPESAFSLFDDACDAQRHGLRTGGAEKEVRTILVPLEMNERSQALLRAASSWADQLGARLILLHVCRLMTLFPPLATARQFEEWNQTLQKNGRDKFAGWVDRFRDDPIIKDASVVVVAGLLEDEIVKAADSMAVDLVMLSTHAYHGLRRVFCGSKAASVLRHAPCSVLILPIAELPFHHRKLEANGRAVPAKNGRAASLNTRENRCDERYEYDI